MTAYHFFMYFVSPFLVAFLYRRSWTREWKVIMSVVVIACLHTLATFLDGGLTFPPSPDFWQDLIMAYGIQQGVYQAMPKEWLKELESIDPYGILDSGTEVAEDEVAESFKPLKRRRRFPMSQDFEVLMPQSDEQARAQEREVASKPNADPNEPSARTGSAESNQGSFTEGSVDVGTAAGVSTGNEAIDAGSIGGGDPVASGETGNTPGMTNSVGVGADSGALNGATSSGTSADGVPSGSTPTSTAGTSGSSTSTPSTSGGTTGV